jgi:hypothetical protein
LAQELQGVRIRKSGFLARELLFRGSERFSQKFWCKKKLRKIDFQYFLLILNKY